MFFQTDFQRAVTPNGMSLHLHLETLFDLKGKTVSCIARKGHFSLSGEDCCISLNIEASSADEIQAIKEAFESGLDLKICTHEHVSVVSMFELIADSVGEMADRVKRLEAAVSESKRSLKCFLSYRFSDKNEKTVRQVTDFMRLLGVTVVTGQAYEPRTIRDKVFSKLQQPLDFIVLLIAEDGESMWTRDEIGTAIHQKLPLVPLVQKGAATFEPGLFGNIEFVEFDRDHIGDCFLKMLEAITYIREKCTTEGPQTDSDDSRL